MKVINPYIQLRPGLVMRHAELMKQQDLYLEYTWNKHEVVHCLCGGEPKALHIGKRNAHFYFINRDPEAHEESCPLRHQSVATIEYYQPTQQLQRLLETTLIDIGCYYWNPRFRETRHRQWFRYKFTEAFNEGLLFYPLYQKGDKTSNVKELQYLSTMAGDGFYVAGFIYNKEARRGKHGKVVYHLEIKGFNHRFVVTKDVYHAVKLPEKLYDYFCLIYCRLDRRGYFRGVNMAGVYVHKKTLTPHYEMRREVDTERVFKSFLYGLKDSVMNTPEGTSQD